MAQAVGQQSLPPLSAVVWSEVTTPAWSCRKSLKLGPLQQINVRKCEVDLSSLITLPVLIASFVRGERSHQPWDRVMSMVPISSC